MKSLSFFKYQAQGNHFILLDDRTLFFPTHHQKLIQHLCHPCFGIGADGLILMQPSETSEIRMRIFNSDGREADSCGNGIFCIAKLFFDLGFSKKKISIKLNHSIAYIRPLSDERFALKLSSYKDLYLHQSIQIDEKKIGFHQVNTGVDHVVVFLEDLQTLNVERLGRKIRNHPHFHPKGTNVNFVSIDEKNILSVRTYEKGVEKETYACGTGAWAVAVVSSLVHPAKDFFEIRHPGGVYTIQMNQNIKNLEMLGSSSKIFEGSLEMKELQFQNMSI